MAYSKDLRVRVIEYHRRQARIGTGCDDMQNAYRHCYCMAQAMQGNRQRRKASPPTRNKKIIPEKRPPMRTAKKSRKHSAATRHQCWNLCANSASREKRALSKKEQYPEKVAAYPDKIKDIPEKSLVYINETAIKTHVHLRYACSPRI